MIIATIDGWVTTIYISILKLDMTVIDYLVLMVEHLLAQLHFNEFLSFYGLFLAAKEPA